MLQFVEIERPDKLTLAARLAATALLTALSEDDREAEGLATTVPKDYVSMAGWAPGVKRATYRRYVN